jgi:hypothetical protein
MSGAQARRDTTGVAVALFCREKSKRGRVTFYVMRKKLPDRFFVGHADAMTASLHLLLRDQTVAPPVPKTFDGPDEDRFGGIRCPRCAWRPSASSLWTCNCVGTPEPYFVACGTVWNTFLTRGRCPGCSHQWQWTTCHQCDEASPHGDWYETPRPLGPEKWVG